MTGDPEDTDRVPPAADTAPRPRRRWGELWGNGDFMKFWVGETVSLFGSQITALAVPLTAVLVLNASPNQLGLLRFLEYIPFLLFTLVFGVWVDRRRRRSIMLVANAARGLLVGLVPVLAVTGSLHLWLLYAITFAVGVFTVLFDLCWLSLVPTIVPTEHLVEGNSKVATTASAADVAGPGVAGVLIQAVGAPKALIADALSYVVSFVFLLTLGIQESPAAPAGRRELRREISEGLALIVRERYLLATAAYGAIWNFAVMINETVFLLYAVRQLHYSPGLIGLIFAMGAVGGVLGAALASTVSRRFPFGRVVSVAAVCATVPAYLFPAAGGPEAAMITLFVVGFFMLRGGIGVANVLTITLRQTVTPNRMLGRMNASMRMILFGIGPLGAIVGGLLGTSIGLHPTLWVAATVFVLSLVPLLASSIPRLAALPPAPQDDEVAVAVDS
ncbi:MAG TPA: MFS transporter [Mycobacteriales bacterium]|nr:MFS transporter [Mycobacteriales bacterium]